MQALATDFCFFSNEIKASQININSHINQQTTKKHKTFLEGKT
jgi:hypothetical protein